MDSAIVELLRNYSRTSGSDFVFTNAAGGRLGWLQHGFRKALVRAGLSDLHFHDLRHTFASCWMMAGGELYALKDILGHKSIAMTQRYTHLSPAYRRSMVHRMEQIWAKPAGQSKRPTVVANGRGRLTNAAALTARVEQRGCTAEQKNPISGTVLFS